MMFQLILHEPQNQSHGLFFIHAENLEDLLPENGTFNNPVETPGLVVARLRNAKKKGKGCAIFPFCICLGFEGFRQRYFYKPFLAEG